MAHDSDRNTLVINLTRFGDLLQSAAALRALAQKTNGPGTCENASTPAGKLGLVCLHNFAAAAAFLPGVTEVFPFPGSAILTALATQPAMDKTVATKHWSGALVALEQWQKTIRESLGEAILCNITPTLASKVLAKLLAGEKCVTGFGIDEHGFGVSTTLWANFLQATATSRGVSPFNIVDLFRKVAGDTSLARDASLVPPEDSLRRAMREKLTLANPQARGFVALQLGASEERRRWPAAFFAAVGEALWCNLGFCPVLLGSGDEKRLAEKYSAAATQPFISLVGKTSLPELAAVLQNTALLISNDTGTLHLASGLGVPVIGIFLATAQPWDTGPYAQGSISLEPDMPCHPCSFGTRCPHDNSCRAAISPRMVTGIAEAVISGSDPSAAAQLLEKHDTRIWRTSRDASGFADLLSLSGHDTAMRTVWLRLQRHLYRQFLDRKPDEPFVPAPFPELPPMPLETAEQLAHECATASSMVSALREQGTMLLTHPLPKITERFWISWQRLSAYLRDSSYLPVLSLLWQIETQNCQEISTAIELAKQYQTLFEAIIRFLPHNARSRQG